MYAASILDKSLDFQMNEEVHLMDANVYSSIKIE